MRTEGFSLLADSICDCMFMAMVAWRSLFALVLMFISCAHFFSRVAFIASPIAAPIPVFFYGSTSTIYIRVSVYPNFD